MLLAHCSACVWVRLSALALKPGNSASAAETLSDDGGLVDEDVLAARCWGDETKAFLIIEDRKSVV